MWSMKVSFKVKPLFHRLKTKWTSTLIDDAVFLLIIPQNKVNICTKNWSPLINWLNASGDRLYSFVGFSRMIADPLFPLFQCTPLHSALHITHVTCIYFLAYPEIELRAGHLSVKHPDHLDSQTRKFHRVSTSALQVIIITAMKQNSGNFDHIFKRKMFYDSSDHYKYVYFLHGSITLK